MKTGICPKCNSTEVFRCESDQIPFDSGRGTPLSFRLSMAKAGKFLPGAALATLEFYVCRECGYLETYVLDIAALSELGDSLNWQRVKG